MITINRKKPCKSCGSKTRHRDINGLPHCYSCERREDVFQMVQSSLINEDFRKCCKCKATMEKSIYPSIESLYPGDMFVVIDKCPGCGSIFLDKGELKRIELKIQETV